MSHTVAIKLDFKDAASLSKSCEALTIPYQSGPQQVKLFTETVECDFSMRLPGWKYPVAVNTQTGEIKIDNYNGDWGKEEELIKFQQEYVLQVAEAQYDVQQLLMQGWQANREHQENGDVQLILTEPG